jgi:hypothetical protein
VARSFTLLGLELGSSVLDWGQVEEVKEVLLAETQLFVGEHRITLDNSDGRFSPSLEGGLFWERSLQNVQGEVATDGNIVFRGFVKDLPTDYQAGTCTVVMENAFTKPTDLTVIRAGQGLNPAYLMLSILEDAGLEEHVDRASFVVAAGPAIAAGAVVDVAFDAGSNTKVLEALQKLGELASISVFVRDGLVRAKAYRPYQGQGAELRFPITPALVREFGETSKTFENFRNSVNVRYDVNGDFFAQDYQAIRRNGIERNFQFNTATGQPLSVPDLRSAEFFALNFLRRAAPLRDVVTLTGGAELQGIRIGDRHPLTAPKWGWTEAPFEVIETHQALGSGEVSLKLVSLV